MRTCLPLLVSISASLAACAQVADAPVPSAKAPVVDQFLAAASGDKLAGSIQILGDLAFAGASGPVACSASPRYHGYRVNAAAGDHVDVWVRSENGDGDAVAWLLDSRMHVVAKNDDADATTLDAHVVADIAAGADPVHYVVFRDYADSAVTFSVTLSGGPLMKVCQRDADCVRVPASCCAVGNNWDAVAAGHETAFRDALACGAHEFCPTFVVVDDDTQAECNHRTHLCEAVAAEDIACGGGMPGAHGCPDRFACVGAPIDRPGHCVQECSATVACRDDASCGANPDCTVGEAGCMGLCQ